jgi:hypothetical protein
MSNAIIAFVLALVVAVLIYTAFTWVVIWALNTLFGLSLVFSWKIVLAIVVLISAVKFINGSGGKEYD